MVLGLFLSGWSLLKIKRHCTDFHKALDATGERLDVMFQNREGFTLKGMQDDDTYYSWIQQETGERYLSLCVDAYTPEDTEKEDFVLPMFLVVIGTPEEVQSHLPTHCVRMRGSYLSLCKIFDPSIEDRVQALKKKLIIFLGLELGIEVPTSEH